MSALPGALLGLVRLLCHQSVLDPTTVSGSLPRPLRHTNGWRMPASRDGLVARFRCGGFYRRPAKAVKPRRMAVGLAPHCLVRKAAATLPRPPGPDAASKAPRAPGRSTISDPSTRGAGGLEFVH